MVRMSDILKKARDRKPREEWEERQPQESQPEEKQPEESQSEENPVVKADPTAESTPEVLEKPPQPQIQKEQEEVETPVAQARPQVSISPILRREFKSVAGGEECKKYYEEGIQLVKQLLDKKDSIQEESAEIKKIVDLVSNFIAQQINNNEYVLDLLNHISRENELYVHPINVCILSVELGLGIKYSKPKLIKLGAAAILHDIEMIKSSKYYRQSHRLSVKDYKKIIESVLSGVKILENIYKMSLSAVLHEPQKAQEEDLPHHHLTKDSIEEYAQIIGLVEIYEVLIHTPSYHDRLTPYEALKEIIGSKDFFDRKLAKTIVERIGPFPVGSHLKLSSGEKARVVKRILGSPLRPVVEVISNSEGKELEEQKTINLSQHPAIFIKRYLKEEAQ